jgi:hypothetical protein
MPVVSSMAWIASSDDSTSSVTLLVYTPGCGI